MVPDVRKGDETRAHKTDEGGRGGHSSRDKDAERRPRDKESKSDKDRTSSRGSRGGRDDDTRDKSRENTARKFCTERNTGRQSSERDQKSRIKSDEVNEDERDRREVAEIMCRMEDRKATKESDVARRAATDKGKSAPGIDSKATKEKREGGDVAKGAIKETAKPPEVPKKLSNTRRDTADANTAQRDAAMQKQRASEETSDTKIVTQSTIGKSSGRQRGAKKATDKVSAIATDDIQSLEVQNFIAGQYPPVEEGVSSTVRLGGALGSGALGRRTDDPKTFGAAVNIIECSVRLQTTNNKAKIPVSAAPPNSIDSEAEGEAVSHDTTFDVQLSQSATDLGTQIDLPGGKTEIESREKYGNKDVSNKGLEMSDTPVNSGLVAPPLLPYAGGESGESGRRVLDDPEMSDKHGVGAKILRSPRNVILAEFNRKMEEIDVSTLVQKELIRTEPHLASAASFLSVVSGRASNSKI